jgi:AAA domain
MMKVPKAFPNSVFYFNEPLPSFEEFYGRVRERTTLLERTRKGSSTSIIGPRRIGKTWLIDYLKLVVPVEFGPNFQFGTLDGTMPKCKTIAEFTTRVLGAFSVPLIASNQANMDLDLLEKLVKDLQLKHIIPVLCIDEFEGFFNQQEFDCDFYAGLRYIASNGLVLVTASKRPLIELVGERCQTSGFFNIFHQLALKPFDKVEAEEFAQAKSAQAGFTPDEHSALLKYGQEKNRKQQWPPLRLQLIGKVLQTDKNLAITGKQHLYRPNDINYWREFEERLEETYRGAVL